MAVIGGGLTGLTTAYYLSILLPASSQITLYEGTLRTGGWIDSGKSGKSEGTVSTNHGEITPDRADILEAGARMVAPQKNTCRHDDLLLLELIDQLGLHDELRISTSKQSQYIYYPDRLVEVSLANNKPELQNEHKGKLDAVNFFPRLWYWASTVTWAASSLKKVLSEPLFRGTIPSVLSLLSPSTEKAEKTNARMIAASKSPGRHPPPSDDESVGAFITRLAGGNTAIAENFFSAIMHGIYGGDVWKISAASSILRNQWLNEAVMPLFKLYDRQAKIADLRQQQAARNGRARPEDHDDWPGQNDGMGGGIAGHAPLTEETLKIAQVYHAAKGRVVLAMESDVDLLVDILTRLRERYKRMLPMAARKREEAGDDTQHVNSPVDTFPMLALSSKKWSLFGFANGFGTLTDALTKSLRQKPNVTIRQGEPVTSLKYEAKQGQVRVVTPRTKDKGGELYDRVVSTLSSPALFRLAGGSAASEDGHGGQDGQLPSLKDAHAVTIMVVNLHYATPRLHAPAQGFGYLIPQSVPLEQNPECALGVMFDTDRENEMRRLANNEVVEPTSYEQIRELREALREKILADVEANHTDEAMESRGSKYTVMLGGHYWDGYRYPDDFPSEKEAVRMAEAVLHRHLAKTIGFSEEPGKTMPRPIATRTKLCRECIPQHYVGHAKRMADLDADLRKAFGGRLAVAGGSFTATGPGVLPSIRSAYDIALRVADRGYRSTMIQNSRLESDMAHVGDTGLGRFADPSTDRILPQQKAAVLLRYSNESLYRKGSFFIWQPDKKDLLKLV